MNVHRALDAALEVAYGVDFDCDEEKVVARLFRLYAEKAAGELVSDIPVELPDWPYPDNRPEPEEATMEAMELMDMGADNPAWEDLAYGLAHEMLKRKGYELFDGDWMPSRRGVVAADGGCLVFVDVSLDEGDGDGFEPPRKDRGLAEICAYRWLSRYDGQDARVRFDSVQVKAMPNLKGFVKHIVNLYGSIE